MARGLGVPKRVFDRLNQVPLGYSRGGVSGPVPKASWTHPHPAREKSFPGTLGGSGKVTTCARSEGSLDLTSMPYSKVWKLELRGRLPPRCPGPTGRAGWENRAQHALGESFMDLIWWRKPI